MRELKKKQRVRIFNYKLKNGRLISDGHMYLLDLSGKLCGEGNRIDLTIKEPSIHSLSNGKVMKKISWVK